MPDLLALEWDHDQICGVAANVSPGRVRVRRCFTLARPAVAAAGSGALPVDWLRSQLSNLGLSGGDVLVTLPRDEAVVKRIDLPEATDDELPVLVRFQAGAKSSVSLGDLSLDFIPLPRRNEVPGREVLMATVPQPTILEIRTLCEMAGLKLTSLGLTPAAVAELVARAEPAAAIDLAGASLVVSQHGSRLEISVFRRCHLLFAHSARLSVGESGPEPQAIVAEVSRALVALRGAVADVKIERVWTLLDAAAHEQLSEVLRKRLGCDVGALNPFAGVEFDRPDAEPRGDRSQFSGPIGLLLARAEPRVPGIDFLAPRQPPVKRDTRKRKLVTYGAGVAALVALLIGNRWLTVSGLDADIADLQAAEAGLTALLDKGKPTLSSAAQIERWEQGGTPWLDQWVDIVDRMPATDRIYLESLTLESKSNRVPARIMIKGFARQHDDIAGLTDRFLAADERYRVKPHAAKETGEDQLYPWRFDNIEIQLNEPPPKKKGAAAKSGSGEKRAPPKPEAAAKSDAAKPDRPKPDAPKPAEARAASGPAVPVNAEAPKAEPPKADSTSEPTSIPLENAPPPTAPAAPAANPGQVTTGGAS